MKLLSRHSVRAERSFVGSSQAPQSLPAVLERWKAEVRIAKLWSELKRPLLWQVGRLLFAVSRDQAFLDRAGWILSLAPGRQRRSWALRLLSLSPHYFIYQWTELYGGEAPAGDS